MPLDERTPILVGAEQINAPFPAPEPVALLAQAIQTSGHSALIGSIDSIQVVAIGTRRYSDPGRVVGRLLGLQEVHTAYTQHGGHMPQSLVTRAAHDIWNGRFRTVAIGGAESWRTRRRHKRAGVDPGWAVQDPAEQPDERIGGELRMGSEFENSLGFGDPLDAYPLFETAIRHAHGRSLPDHADHVAHLWESFNRVARDNPYAAIRRPLTAEEIDRPSDSNRLISHPYPKLEVANNSVDQAAAVIMTSVGEARRLRIPSAQWVFLHGAGEVHDTNSIAARASLHESRAIEQAARTALHAARVHVDDIALVDVYSCFPSAVQIGADALGVSDRSILTVTGGLTFAGGPWNNYVTHALATLIQQLRQSPDEYALCTANGGLLTKHAVGIYSARPSVTPPAEPRTGTCQKRHETIGSHDGYATVAAYTVRYATSGERTHGFAICETETNSRMLTRFESDDVMEWLTKNEGVGRRARVSGTQLIAIE